MKIINNMKNIISKNKIEKYDSKNFQKFTSTFYCYYDPFNWIKNNDDNNLNKISKSYGFKLFKNNNIISKLEMILFNIYCVDNSNNTIYDILGTIKNNMDEFKYSEYIFIPHRNEIEFYMYIDEAIEYINNHLDSLDIFTLSIKNSLSYIYDKNILNHYKYKCKYEYRSNIDSGVDMNAYYFGNHNKNNNKLTLINYNKINSEATILAVINDKNIPIPDFVQYLSRYEIIEMNDEYGMKYRVLVGNIYHHNMFKNYNAFDQCGFSLDDIMIYISYINNK